MAIYVQMNNKSYRKGVGIIIVNSDLQFFLGKRIGADAWQFPQGGIDEGETPEEALYRELYEETGLERDKIEILDKSKKWLVYHCLLYTSPSPRDTALSRMPSSA